MTQVIMTVHVVRERERGGERERERERGGGGGGGKEERVRECVCWGGGLEQRASLKASLESSS